MQASRRMRSGSDGGSARRMHIPSNARRRDRGTAPLRAADNSLTPTRLGGGNAMVPCLSSCPRMRADGPPRRAAQLEAVGQRHHQEHLVRRTSAGSRGFGFMSEAFRACIRLCRHQSGKADTNRVLDNWHLAGATATLNRSDCVASGGNETWNP